MNTHVGIITFKKFYFRGKANPLWPLTLTSYFSGDRITLPSFPPETCPHFISEDLFLMSHDGTTLSSEREAGREFNHSVVYLPLKTVLGDPLWSTGRSRRVQSGCDCLILKKVKPYKIPQLLILCIHRSSLQFSWAMWSKIPIGKNNCDTIWKPASAVLPDSINLQSHTYMPNLHEGWERALCNWFVLFWI